MASDEGEEKKNKALEVLAQFKKFGNPLYTYQDFADDFDLSEESVFEILNSYNTSLSKEEVISKLIKLK